MCCKRTEAIHALTPRLPRRARVCTTLSRKLLRILTGCLTGQLRIPANTTKCHYSEFRVNWKMKRPINYSKTSINLIIHWSGTVLWHQHANFPTSGSEERKFEKKQLQEQLYRNEAIHALTWRLYSEKFQGQLKRWESDKNTQRFLC